MKGLNTFFYTVVSFPLDCWSTMSLILLLFMGMKEWKIMKINIGMKIIYRILKA